MEVLGYGFRYDRTDATAAFVTELLPTCELILRGDSASRKAFAIYQIGNLGSTAVPLLTDLLAVAGDANAFPPAFAAGRRMAVQSVGQIGAEADRCLPVLVTALDDPELVEAAIRAIGRFERLAVRLRPRLKAFAIGKDLKLATAAKEALEQIDLPARPEAGMKAPRFSVPRLSGEGTISSKVHDGRWVYIDVWATICAPCHPVLDQLNVAVGGLSTEQRGRLTVIAISLDISANKARRTVQSRRWGNVEHGWSNPGNSLMKDFRIGPIPDGLLINPTGKIVWRGNPYGKDMSAFFAGHLD
ncbi:MAG: thioredoxin-like domain-containing protein [Limisphaerales bacterium]